jgi:Zn-dependent peptidase ImmA (M78 family)
MKNNRIQINPALLIWARERAGLDADSLVTKFPKIVDWELGSVYPTLNQLEQFARTVHVSVGYLFLPEPPTESLPIPDFRTVGSQSIERPSPNLLDTIYMCQQRQDWYRDYAMVHSLPKLTYVGSARLTDNPTDVAAQLATTLNLPVEDRMMASTWTDALRMMVHKAEDAGILVMSSGVVGSNSHRKLNVNEFRGFTLVDDLAPLLFINSADSKAAQMFTLAHELAHIWLGQSGVSNAIVGQKSTNEVERWCNAVAAEFLVPIVLLKEQFVNDEPIENQIQRLARMFKVSTLVVLRRMYEAGFINYDQLSVYYRGESDRILALDRRSGGGDFYRTLGVRTGKQFARAIIVSALEGHTLFKDAYRMLGIKKSATFNETAKKMGVL